MSIEFEVNSLTVTHAWMKKPTWYMNFLHTEKFLCLRMLAFLLYAWGPL